MIEDQPQLTVKRPSRRPTAAQRAAFSEIPTSFVTDAMGGSGALSADIGPLFPHEPSHMVGSAVTCWNGPGDVQATVASLAFLEPGDVVVISVDGFQGCASAGDSVLDMAKNSGAVGLVTEGKVRDAEGMARVGLPVWCTGITPNSPSRTGPGTVGLPISCGGLQVETGDLVIADGDGVVVVPFARIDEVIQRLEDVKRVEVKRDTQVKTGLKVPQQTLDLLNGPMTRYVD